ncbi:MAG TPA: hypothetical protein VHH15_19255 [Actinophytocola sp.]|nr:hypothetical protein [Actinophytocola sp.]
MTKARNRFAVFDIRLVIALLIGIYGAVITVMGVAVTSDEDIERSAGVNINLWAGLGMLAVAAAFVLWTVLRPLRVSEEKEETGADQA